MRGFWTGVGVAVGVVIGAIGACAQLAPQSYLDAFAEWRKLDPTLERDAANAGPQVADRVTKIFSAASKYTVTRSEYLRSVAEESGQLLLWLQNSASAGELDLAPAQESQAIVNVSANTVVKDIATYANDPDRGIQQLRQALERERAALAALGEAIGNRDKATATASLLVDPAEQARAAAMTQYQTLAAGYSAAAEQAEREQPLWAAYYQALSDAASRPAPAPRSAAPAATDVPTPITIGGVRIMNPRRPNPAKPDAAGLPAAVPEPSKPQAVKPQPAEAKPTLVEPANVAPPQSQPAQPPPAEAKPTPEATPAAAQPPRVTLPQPQPAQPQPAQPQPVETKATPEAKPTPLEPASGTAPQPQPAQPPPAEVNLATPLAAPLSRYAGEYDFPESDGAFLGTEPESATLEMHEEKSGLSGSFAGRFKVAAETDPAVQFTFSGELRPGRNQTLALESGDGAKGTLDLIYGPEFDVLEVHFHIEPREGKLPVGIFVLVKK